MFRWPTWSQRFKRFRLAEKLHKEKGDMQVSSLLYVMGDESETILKTFALTDVEQNYFDTDMSSWYTSSWTRSDVRRHETDVVTISHALPQFVCEQCLHLTGLVQDLCDADTYYCGTIHNNSSCVLVQMSMVRLQDKSEELTVIATLFSACGATKVKTNIGTAKEQGNYHVLFRELKVLD